MLLTSKNTPKIVSGLVLFAVCFGILFSFSHSVRAAELYQDPGYPPGVGEDQAKNVKDSGGPGAGLVASFVGNTALKAADYILTAISWFAAKIITFEAGILNWILNPTSFRLATAPIVQKGWDVARTTVNMFFVLVLLIISFSTILRIESYGIKSLLPRLILVALLINFSLVIAGAILDFTNVLTTFFYQSLGSGGSDLAGKLTNGLRITNFFAPNENPDPKALEGIFHFGGSILSAFAGILTGTIFLMATIFIFLALIVMMIIRVLNIWILLILAPVAWFFYIIPALQSQWYKWWNNFFRWAFFAPIAMFFIYLSIISLDKMGPGTNENVNFSTLSQAAKVTVSGNNMTKNPVEAIFQFLIGAGLILGSLMVANSMSITGAGMATSLGKRAGKSMGVWAARKAQAPTARWAGAAGERLDKTWVGRTWGVRQLTRPLQRYAETGRVYDKQMEEQYKKGSTEYLSSLHGKVDSPKKRAIESILAERGQLDKIFTDPKTNSLDSKALDNAIERASKGGNNALAKSLIKFDPRSASRINQKLLNAVMGVAVNNVDDVLDTLKPEDWVKMDKTAFADKTVTPKLIKKGRGAHIAKLGSEGAFDKMNEIQALITSPTLGATPKDRKKALAASNPALADYISKTAGQFGLHF